MSISVRLGQALAACVLLLLQACSATGADASGEPRSIAVSLHGVGSAPLELVSESHTQPVELYSEERAVPSTKVQEDEVMAALVEHLDGLGFGRYARTGTVPAGGGGATFAKALEVRDGGSSAWWALTPTATRDEIVSFGTAMKDFLQLYNGTQGWQSVENEAGSDYFDSRKRTSVER